MIEDELDVACVDKKKKNGCRMHTTKFFYKNIVVSLSPC